MTTLSNDIGNICNQYNISKEDEIKFNKLRDEIATLGQQIITLNETRYNAINKMQELLDKYTVDAKIVNDFISNVEKYPNATIINDKQHTSKTAPKNITDESEDATESKPKKINKKKPQVPKKSGAAATTIEDEPENSEPSEPKDESETQENPEQETQENPEQETQENPEPETQENPEPETQENPEPETSEIKEEQEEDQEEEIKPSKKAPAKKLAAKKVPAKKTTKTTETKEEPKPAAKKAPVKKAPVKKPAAKKAPAKKTA